MVSKLCNVSKTHDNNKECVQNNNNLYLSILSIKVQWIYSSIEITIKYIEHYIQIRILSMYRQLKTM
jgi:hypothetical protein